MGTQVKHKHAHVVVVVVTVVSRPDVVVLQLYTGTLVLDRFHTYVFEYLLFLVVVSPSIFFTLLVLPVKKHGAVIAPWLVLRTYSCGAASVEYLCRRALRAKHTTGLLMKASRPC